MSIYLGQLGRMIEIKCPASQQVSSAERFTFQQTLEGRVKAQARPIGRRVWGLSSSAAMTPADQATILSFVNGEWGNGPFVFVSADAPVTNLLSPAAASCDPSTIANSGVTAAGPLSTADGWAGRSFFNPNPGANMYFGSTLTPVIPGIPVTGSAYVVGDGAKVSIQFLDSTGAIISATPSPGSGVAGSTKRLNSTATPPPNAASARLFTTGSSQAARPAITWTSVPFEWAAGEGCPKSVVHAASKDLTLASREVRGGRFASINYTITEVG